MPIYQRINEENMFQCQPNLLNAAHMPFVQAPMQFMPIQFPQIPYLGILFIKKCILKKLIQ